MKRNPKFQSFDELKTVLETNNRTGLLMSHIYMPAMLLTVIRNGGKSTREEISKDFVLRDTQQIEHYRRNIVKKMPGDRLVRDGYLDEQGQLYELSEFMRGLSPAQLAEVEEILEHRIQDYLATRNYPFGNSNQDAVRGSDRYAVLKRAGSRCEACGVSAKETQIDVDHILPRAKGGSNDLSNLQALCRTCNAQKRDRDDTDFRVIAESYSERELGCPFCDLETEVVAENELAFVILDKYPVTIGHSLVIPKRHVVDYFDLHMPERNALEALIHSQHDALQSKEPEITGFNIGVNANQSAGQTVFHAHVHLIPRRDGDLENPRGGVRAVIPGMANYRCD